MEWPRDVSAGSSTDVFVTRLGVYFDSYGLELVEERSLELIIVES